ncbi:MAG: hypothetical protein ABFD89_28090 [Bryobacteraceae bacterium]
MTPLEVLQMCNAALATASTAVVLIEKIRADVSAGSSDAAVTALLAQIDSNHSAILALLASEQLPPPTLLS